MERKIKELFENDPIEILKQVKDSPPKKKNFMMMSNFNSSITNLNNGGNKTDKMKQAMGSFLFKNIQKEAKNASAE